ncbi:unnamed protein product [Brachionus calyciflorus]|uniref:Uncharacterized protein n=1 Tax=Brachionus calyciflorus TaxID=104777 RepID=A0A814NVJ8_9BILA|nr:unnamed protein product [Brachionus calyciflorus]
MKDFKNQEIDKQEIMNKFIDNQILLDASQDEYQNIQEETETQTLPMYFINKKNILDDSSVARNMMQQIKTIRGHK